MIKIIKKDILSVEKGIIGHQVNCQGKFAAGLAGQIAKKWPIAKQAYLEALESYKHYNLKALDQVSRVEVESGLYVAHLFSQNYYGRKKQYTDYSSLGCTLHKLYHTGTALDLQVYLPKIGCGLGGGNWDEVRRIIESECPGAIICIQKE